MDAKDRKMMLLLTSISFLKSAPLFRAVPAEYLIELAEIMEEISVFQGEVLFNQGEYGDSLYLVQEGEVSISTGGRSVAVLGPGECIGEMALLDGEPRSATCTAIKNARLLRISSESFMSFLVTHAEVAQTLLRTLAQRLRLTHASSPRAVP